MAIPPPPFPTRFTFDEESDDQTLDTTVEWPNSSEGISSVHHQWTTVQTEGERHIAVLEASLVKAKGLSRHRSPPPPTTTQLDDEGHALVESAAPISGSDNAEQETDSDSGSGSDESLDMQSIPARRTVSLSFAPLVKIGGAGKRPVSSRTSSLHRNTPRRLSLDSHSIETRPQTILKRPSNYSRASSINPPGSYVTSSVVSLASSPCSSIYAPLLQSALTAPSPSRTMAIYQAQQLGRSVADHDPYKTLVREQKTRKASNKLPKIRPLTAVKADADYQEEETSSWTCFGCCFPSTNKEKAPILPKTTTKSECDVRFGPRPYRYFSRAYWIWWIRSSAGNRVEDEG